MIPTREELIGTWISKDFPKYHYEDAIEFKFYFAKYATLYYSKGNNMTIVEGIYDIEDMGEENFNIIVDGSLIGSKKCTLNAKFYIKQKPQCFVMLVPEQGLRYLKKQNKAFTSALRSISKIKTHLKAPLARASSS